MEKNQIKTKQQLVDEVIEEIKRDISSGDLSALDEMLMMIPMNILQAYLPEPLNMGENTND